jgi:surface-anchored protein
MKTPSILLATGFLAGPSSAAVLSSGHADVFGIGYVDEDTPGVFELEPHVHAENAIVDGMLVADGEYEPGDVTILVPQTTFDFVATGGGRPSGSEWDLIGVAAGEGFWFLPQSNTGPGGAATLGTVFAGVGTEELSALEWSTPISIALQSVAGPGHFSMWLDGFTPTFAISSADGIDGTDLLSVAAGGHEHYNWGFSAPGTYGVTVTVSGTHATDGFKEATAIYQFQVVPEPSVALFGLASGLILLRRHRR